MRLLVVLCLVAATCADQFGYNYKPVGHSNSGSSFTPGSNIISGVSSNLGVSLGGGLASLPHGVDNMRNGGVGAGILVGSSAVTYETPSYSTPVESEREFYTFSAPESEFDDVSAAKKIAGSVKQGLRVIFIKGPENNAVENAALSLAKHVTEKKTAIYVLNKQADISDLAHKFNVINKNSNSKPEVHFVKYRTTEDAVNAQRAIQGQYDTLAGSTQAHNNVVAPVLNFASPAFERYAPVHSPGNAYLPISTFRRV